MKFIQVLLVGIFSLLLSLPWNSDCFGETKVRFIDATNEAGITFRHHSSPEKKYIVEVMSGGVAWFDADNDGWPDLFFLNSLTVETKDNPEVASSHLYRNKRDGTFENVTSGSGLEFPGWGQGVSAGDYNGDRLLDLYITCLGPNRLFKNNGDFTFTDVSEEAGITDERWSIGSAFGDYDNDGDLDLFVSNYVDFSLDHLPTFGKGHWCQHRGIPVHCGPRGLKGAGDTLYRNEGDGTFTDVSEEAGVHDPEKRFGLGVLWSDLNDDHFLDLFVNNDTGANYLYLNDQSGHFMDLALFSGVAVSESGMAQGCMGIAIGDYDHDEKLDIYVTNFGEEYNALYKHEGEGLFLDTSFSSLTTNSSLPYVGWGTSFFDYDNDGWVDLFVSNGHVYPQVEFAGFAYTYTQPKLLLRNNRDGTFSNVTSEAGEALMERRASRSAAFGDYDNDGDVDIAINDLDGPPMLLRNEGGNQLNWILIQVEGDNKNTGALGTRVKVVAGDLVQLSEIHSGGSYAAQSDLRQHFGLGDNKVVRSIEIQWPDGSKTIRKNVEANRIITIRKGE